jgi:uncharacterized protein (TIRG00374 family)
MTSSPISEDPKPSFWKRYGSIIRFLISIVLLARAIQAIDWVRVQAAVPTIDWKWLLLSLLILLISYSICSQRWAFIMQAAGFRKSAMDYLRLYFAGGLINQGLPTTLGGDSYRAIAAHRILQKNYTETTSLPYSFMGVLLDRSMGLAGLCILGAIGIAVGGSVLGEWVPQLGLALLLVMLLGSVCIATLLKWHISKKIYVKLMQGLKIQHPLAATEATWGLTHLWWQILIAILIHCFALLAFWACLKACHVDAPIEALLIGIPALGLLMLLPISISGWGLRETSLASILALWGLDPSLVILSSILYGIIILISYLPGLPRLIQKG